MNRHGFSKSSSGPRGTSGHPSSPRHLRNPGPPHLNPAQIDDHLIGDPAPAAARHLDLCDLCAERVAQAEAPLRSFRAVSLAWSERRSATLPLHQSLARASSFHPRLAWAAAAVAVAALAVAIGLPLASHQQQQEASLPSHVAGPASTSASTSSSTPASTPAGIQASASAPAESMAQTSAEVTAQTPAETSSSASARVALAPTQSPILLRAASVSGQRRPLSAHDQIVRDNRMLKAIDRELDASSESPAAFGLLPVSDSATRRAEAPSPVQD